MDYGTISGSMLATARRGHNRDYNYREHSQPD